MERCKNEISPLGAPDIYTYLSSLDFVLARFKYLSSQGKHPSLRKLSKSLNISPAYLSMVLSKKRPMTKALLKKFSENLELSKEEKQYLKAINEFENAKNQESKSQALEKLQNFKAYNSTHPEESDAFEYMTNPLNVIIRELAASENFNEDPIWIQENLISKHPQKHIKKSLNFLITKGYLVRDLNGRLIQSARVVRCYDKIFKVALTNYHQKMFQLAGESIENVTPNKREIRGMTFSIESEKISEIKKILDDAFQKIRNLEAQQNQEKLNQVVQVEIGAFPLSKELPPVKPEEEFQKNTKDKTEDNVINLYQNSCKLDNSESSKGGKDEKDK
jgi:uncharacterized protein (TIGR02147 family)